MIFSNKAIRSFMQLGGLTSLWELLSVHMVYISTPWIQFVACRAVTDELTVV